MPTETTGLSCRRTFLTQNFLGLIYILTKTPNTQTQPRSARSSAAEESLWTPPLLTWKQIKISAMGVRSRTSYGTSRGFDTRAPVIESGGRPRTHRNGHAPIVRCARAVLVPRDSGGEILNLVWSHRRRRRRPTSSRCRRHDRARVYAPRERGLLWSFWNVTRRRRTDLFSPLPL